MSHLFLSRLRYASQRAIRNVTITLALIFSAPAWAAPVTIVALGDSLTAGYGLAPEQGFVPQMQAWLTAQGRDVTLINAGVSGDTTAGGLSRLDWSLTPDTQALIVELGGNDVLRGLPPAEARANLEAILQGAKARGLPVLLIGMQAPGNYGPDYKAAFDAIYPELAQTYGATYAPSFFAPLMEGQTDPAALQGLMQADGIHPNAAGVEKIVAGLGPTVIELLDRLDKGESTAP
jgi:acyl-CoA thioesterase-1